MLLSPCAQKGIEREWWAHAQKENFCNRSRFRLYNIFGEITPSSRQAGWGPIALPSHCPSNHRSYPALPPDGEKKNIHVNPQLTWVFQISFYVIYLSVCSTEQWNIVAVNNPFNHLWIIYYQPLSYFYYSACEVCHRGIGSRKYRSVSTGLSVLRHIYTLLVAMRGMSARESSKVLIHKCHSFSFIIVRGGGGILFVSV